MTVHRLKTWMPYFAAVLDGTKTFEIRPDDRGFKPGDHLLLVEVDGPPDITPTGRQAVAEVTYVMPGNGLGLEPGYVALGLGAVVDARRMITCKTVTEWLAHLATDHPIINHYWAGSPIEVQIGKHNIQHGRWPKQQGHIHVPAEVAT